jgi:hypothetical protein
MIDEGGKRKEELKRRELGKAGGNSKECREICKKENGQVKWPKSRF